VAGQELNFTDTSTVKWTKGAQTGTDPVYGLPIFPLTAKAATGGASVKTANYTAVAADANTLLAFEDASAVTLTLPATPPSSTWTIAVQDVGAGALTISPNGLNLDGSASSLVLSQKQGVLIYTDGTNYFTERGVSNPGTVTSVGLTVPSILSVAGSPITGAGTLAISLATEAANTVFAGPSSGSAATPTFRALAAADLPSSLPTIAGVQDETYTYSADTGTANAYAQTLTPTPTVAAGLSGKFKAANANTGASTLTVAGTTGPLVKNGTQPLAPGDIAVGQIIGWTYDGANFQTGGIAPATALVPLIRGSALTTNSAASITVSLTGLSVPGGGTANAVAGDFALLCYGDQSGGTPSVPSGWTVVVTTSGAVIEQQVVWSKVLTSGDISTGSVTVTVPTGGNNTLGIVVFIGSTGGVREADLVNQTNPITVTTSSAVIAGDTAIYFGTANFNTGQPAPTVNRGTLLQSAASGPNCGSLYDESLATSGAQSAVFSFSTSNSSAATIIVKGVPTGVGSVTSVGLTVPSRQTVSGSPVTGAGTLAITDNTQSANQVFAGPSSGSAAAPTFRALVSADVPGSLTNPMTTQGDIIYGGASGAPTRLPAGTSGQVLQTNGSSAAPSWVAPGGGSGISLTTTGSSGAATLTGTVLNIPVYTGGGGASTPVIRGTGIQASSAASYTVSWPSGTVAGDLAIIFGGHGFGVNLPAGWTSIDSSTGTNWNGATFMRFLSSADITAGSVTVTTAGTFDGTLAIATIKTPSEAIRTVTPVRNGSGASSVTVNTDGSPLTTDLVLYFGSNRAASTNTVSLGTNLRQANDGSAASGCLYAGSPSGVGGVSPVFSYSSAGTGNYQIAVVVKGV